MKHKNANSHTYRRAWWKRFFQYQQFVLMLLLAIGFAFVAVIVSLYDSQAITFSLFSLVFVLALLWLSRPAYYAAHGNKLILTEEGILYHYLGLQAFVAWGDILFFDEDEDRAWLNMAYHSSDIRSARLQILCFC